MAKKRLFIKLTPIAYTLKYLKLKHSECVFVSVSNFYPNQIFAETATHIQSYYHN